MNDTVFYPIADNPAPIVLNPIDLSLDVSPLGFHDTVHISHGVNISILNSVIPGGTEDCVDLNNNCENINIVDTQVAPGGEYGFTIKGGTHHVSLVNVVFQTHGKTVDIDLGNWSDQNTKDKTKDIALHNVTSSDGKPVRVRVLWADKPTVIGGNVKLIVYPSWLVAIWRFFRGL